MSVLDDATIIYVPGVYKTSAVALQKPISAGSVSSLTFARASTATRVNSSGLIESVATNVPRVDYLNGSCGAQLLEPARTNLLTYSEQFDNAAWSKAAAGAGSVPVVTANQGVAPDGTTTADRIQFVTGGATSSDRSILRQLATLSISSNSLTFYVKSNTGAGNQTLAFTFNSGTQSTFQITESDWTRVEYVGNGTVAASFYGIEAQGSTTSNNADVLIWGAQLEAGAYPTSYIKTEALTVTRSAETLSQTGLATELGDSEGTLYFDGVISSSSIAISLGDGTPNNRIEIRPLSGQFGYLVTVGGVAQVNINTGVVTYGDRYKIAIKYSANDFAIWVNGTELASDGIGSTFADGTLTTLNFATTVGTGNLQGKVNALAVWDRALTDTELEDLTT